MMKNKFAWWGLLGLIGVLGIILRSAALSGFVLLFLLFCTATAPAGEAFRRVVAVSGRRAFTSGVIISGAVFLIAALLSKTSLIRLVSFQIELLLLVSALIASYIIGIAIFTVGVIIGGVKLKRNEKEAGPAI